MVFPSLGAFPEAAIADGGAGRTPGGAPAVAGRSGAFGERIVGMLFFKSSMDMAIKTIYYIMDITHIIYLWFTIIIHLWDVIFLYII